MMFRFIFYIQPETPYVENFFSTLYSYLITNYLNIKM